MTIGMGWWSQSSRLQQQQQKKNEAYFFMAVVDLHVAYEDIPMEANVSEVTGKELSATV